MKIEIKRVPNIFAKLAETAKNKSPELLIVGGLVAFGATIFATSKAVLANKDAMDSAKEEIAAIENTPASEEYTREDSDKDIRLVKRKARRKTIKATAPAVIFGSVTIACFMGADYIRRQRYAALFASSEMVLKAFNDYRDGVRERYGDDVDKELRYKLVKREVEEEPETTSKGKKKAKVEEKTVSQYDGHSEFSRYFDESSRRYEKDPQYNKTIILEVQRALNRTLRQRWERGLEGSVSVNEAYDALGFDRIGVEGQHAGWIYDPDDPSCQEDRHIDFGIFNVYRDSKKADFVNGYERCVLLDFNVDTLDIYADRRYLDRKGL